MGRSLQKLLTARSRSFQGHWETQVKFLPRRKTVSSTRTQERSERRWWGCPGCAAAGGHGASNHSVPFWRIYSEVRNSVPARVLTSSPPPVSKYKCDRGQQDATDDGKYSAMAARRGKDLLCNLAEMLSCALSCFEGNLFLAAESLPAGMRRGCAILPVAALGDEIQEMGLGRAGNGNSFLSVMSFSFSN